MLVGGAAAAFLPCFHHLHFLKLMRLASHGSKLQVSCQGVRNDLLFLYLYGQSSSLPLVLVLGFALPVLKVYDTALLMQLSRHSLAGKLN